MANVTIKTQNEDNTSGLNNASLQNAATETTLRELVNISKNGGSSSAANSSRSAAKSVEKLGREAKSSSDMMILSSQQAADEMRNTAGRMKLDMTGMSSKIGPAGDRVANVMEVISHKSMDSAELTERLGNAMGRATEGVGGFVKKIGEKLGNLGGATGAAGAGILKLGAALMLAGAAVLALVAPVALAIKMVQDVNEGYLSLSRTGLVLDTSFGDMMITLNKAKMTLDDFVNFVSRNTQSLVSFSMSLGRGAREIMTLRSSMSEIDVDAFINMGIAMDEVPDALARYMALQGRYAREIARTDEEKVESATELYAVQRALADITGESVDAIQNEMMARTRDTRLNSAFRHLDDEARAEALNSVSTITSMLSTQFGDGIGEAFKAFAAGDITSEEFRQVTSSLPEFAAVFNDMSSMLHQGTLSTAEAMAYYNSTMTARGDALTRDIDRVSPLLQYSGVELLSTVREDLGQARHAAGLFASGMMETYNTVDEVRRGMAGLTPAGTEDTSIAAMTSLTKASANLSVALNSLQASVTSLGSSAGELLNDVASDANQIASAIQLSIEESNSNLSEALDLFGDKVGDLEFDNGIVAGIANLVIELIRLTDLIEVAVNWLTGVQPERTRERSSNRDSRRGSTHTDIDENSSYIAPEDSSIPNSSNLSTSNLNDLEMEILSSFSPPHYSEQPLVEVPVFPVDEIVEEMERIRPSPPVNDETSEIDPSAVFGSRFESLTRELSGLREVAALSLDEQRAQTREITESRRLSERTYRVVQGSATRNA